jgi:beta-ribofuranosylaminobenzene 5'-phosphate synthase
MSIVTAVEAHLRVAETVQVSAPARLHFGLINTSGLGQRIDGGAGVMLCTPSLIVEVEPAERLDIAPAELRDEVLFCLHRAGLPQRPQLQVTIRNDIPAHSGLGWRTQLRLAIVTAVSIALRRTLVGPEYGPLLGRAGTSAVGTWGFWQGGFILEGGHCRHDKSEFLPSSRVAKPTLAPLLYSGSFPWYVVCVLATGMSPISGNVEEQLFRRNTPTSSGDAASCYRVVYGEMLPAVVERDFLSFVEAVAVLQSLGFKRVERELRGDQGYRVERLLAQTGLRGVGLSSWGPAYFGFTESSETAREAVDILSQDPLTQVCWSTRSADAGATCLVNGVHSAVSALLR